MAGKAGGLGREALLTYRAAKALPGIEVAMVIGLIEGRPKRCKLVSVARSGTTQAV